MKISNFLMIFCFATSAMANEIYKDGPGGTFVAADSTEIDQCGKPIPTKEKIDFLNFVYKNQRKAMINGIQIVGVTCTYTFGDYRCNGVSPSPFNVLTACLADLSVSMMDGNTVSMELQYGNLFVVEPPTNQLYATHLRWTNNPKLHDLNRPAAKENTLSRLKLFLERNLVEATQLRESIKQSDPVEESK